MRCVLLVTLATAATASSAVAQPRGRAPGRSGGFRIVQRPTTPQVGPGFIPGSGFGGGFVPGYIPYYVVPPRAFPTGGGVVPASAAPAEPSGATVVSGVLPATLVIEYPAAAKVWLNGVEVPGDAGATWTFTSRDLRRGETATFRVRGRWAVGGKTFESEREVPLGPGARSRLLVVSGTEVRE